MAASPVARQGSSTDLSEERKARLAALRAQASGSRPGSLQSAELIAPPSPSTTSSPTPTDPDLSTIAAAHRRELQDVENELRLQLRDVQAKVQIIPELMLC